MTTYLIYSNDHHLWWRTDGAGYTGSVWDAGRYAVATAWYWCNPNIRTAFGDLPKDVPVPAPELDAETFSLDEVRTLPGLLVERARAMSVGQVTT